MHRSAPVLATTLLAALSTTADAEHPHANPTYDQVELTTSAERKVAQDLLIAALYTEQEGQRQGEIAARINTTMQWALDIAKAADGVKVQTAQYQTWPVYANQSTTITGWRARQSLRLEASDSKRLGDLIGTLQEKLAVESVGYDVSHASREANEKILTDEALARFQARAQQVATLLGRPGYRIVRLSLDGGGAPRPPIALRGMMAAAETAAAPAIEAGAQTLSITVSGTIQLEARP
jgi:predicted secreted protein